MYDLYALSSHMGILGGGHYIAYAKDGAGTWRMFNDSTCKEVGERCTTHGLAHAGLLRSCCPAGFCRSPPSG